MQKTFVVGRTTRDPEVRYTTGEKAQAVARFNIAVDRAYGDGTDFIPCVAFGKRAETIEKYVKQGTKLVIDGHLQSGNYTNKDGVKVYTLDLIVDNFEFAEKKQANESEPKEISGFKDITFGIEEKIPFN